MPPLWVGCPGEGGTGTFSGLADAQGRAPYDRGRRAAAGGGRGVGEAGGAQGGGGAGPKAAGGGLRPDARGAGAGLRV